MKYFDLHCDSLTTALQNSGDMDADRLQVSLGKAASLEEYCQCFAVFLPDTIRGEDAWNYYQIVRHYFDRQLEKFSGCWEQAKTGSDIGRITAAGKTAAVFTIEGGAVLGGKLTRLAEVKADGVKMMTLTWNGENELGFGAPDPKKGLKPFGIEAIREMEHIGIGIDISHLSDAGIQDVFRTVSCPVIATHSNSRPLCGHMRNLEDEYFQEVARRGGLVGINFYKAFLNDDPEKAALQDIARHIARFVELGGEDTVCMGSDFDGCEVVRGLEDLTKLEDLSAVLREVGFTEAQVEKFFWKNAYRYFTNHF